MEHELLWKEVVVLALIGIFSFTFWHRIEEHSLYIGFILLSLVFYLITVADEEHVESKTLRNYFEHTSSYFMLSLGFFLMSYFTLTQAGSMFLLVLLSIAVVLFSVGFMRLLFSRFDV